MIGSENKTSRMILARLTLTGKVVIGSTIILTILVIGFLLYHKYIESN